LFYNNKVMMQVLEIFVWFCIPVTVKPDLKGTSI
jgi:hypothetical protein